MTPRPSKRRRTGATVKAAYERLLARGRFTADDLAAEARGLEGFATMDEAARALHARVQNEGVDKWWVRVEDMGDSCEFVVNDEEYRERYVDLSEDCMYVLQEVIKAGAEGSHVTKLKNDTKRPNVQKHLKTLLNRGLLKKVKSIKVKNKLVYYNADISVDSSHTGGVWYVNGKFDAPFAKEARRWAHQRVYDELGVDVASLVKEARARAEDDKELNKEERIFRAELSTSDMSDVCTSLCRRGSADPHDVGDLEDLFFKPSVSSSSPLAYVEESPCGGCPFAEECEEGNPAHSPERCEYLDALFGSVRGKFYAQEDLDAEIRNSARATVKLER